MENYSEDNIRPADPIIREQLIDDDISDFEKEIDVAIHLSCEEIRIQNEINNKFESDIIDQYNKELSERKNKCDLILLDIKKIIKFDKDIKEIYDIIEPILELYSYQNINYCVFDEKTYNRIFDLLSRIRTNKKNIEFLKSIITKEDHNISIKTIN